MKDLSDPVLLRQFVLLVSAFGLVFSIWCIGLLVMALRRRVHDEAIRRRLGFNEDGPGRSRVLRLWVDGHEAATVVPQNRRTDGLKASLERLRRQADWQAPLSSLVLGLFGTVVAAFLAGVLLAQSVLMGLAGATAAAVGLSIWIGRRIDQRRALFENQLLDALSLAARSLRAGHPLSGAFQLIVEEMPDPIREVFAQICQEQELGVRLEDALRRAALCSESEDLRFFAASVIIQLRTGGNLADMMERLSEVIRERLRLTRRVRVLTTQTQYSKRVLIAMPFIVFAMLQVVNAEYISLLYTTETGRMMIALGAVLVVVGNTIMNRMAVLRY